MPVSLFENRPEQCPYGHSLALGQPQRVGWMPCLCAPALEAGSRGRGLGHLWIWCGACHQEGRETLLYEPSHDPAYGKPNPLAFRSLHRRYTAVSAVD
jgi:hypothetical protein